MWVLFHVIVIGVLALDLGVFHRSSHEVKPKEAGMWTAAWITLALLWCGLIYFTRGGTAGIEFLTGYLIEESLSMDNIFVFVMILSYFQVPKLYQHRVLFWGVIGALVLRATMIGVGAAMVSRFEWILYIFGAFLIYSGIKMAIKDDEEVDPEHNPLVKMVRKFVPITPNFRGDKFFVFENGKKMATPLLLVLVMIETSDVIFAVDSIPAIFAVTKDPFIVYTSNIFAIMGLRSMYFMLAGVVTKFHLLKYGLAAVLTFVGLKMVYLNDAFGGKFPITWSLGFIAGAIGLSIVASLIFPPKEKPEEPVSIEGEGVADGELLETSK